ncbi:Uncharacterised protein [Yersinia pekkanenii]|uniref:Uncharacterized protein n=1 Tax=Yersinia pekkanenii TaxID=1288385 RepID=A0A0T9PQR7_9GAMM|nr:Uncharacterised protein [Yersinia pekkanenii]CRY68601.1 Uncharacterised protein [Yersinia pekkanenii]
MTHAAALSVCVIGLGSMGMGAALSSAIGVNCVKYVYFSQ